MPSSVSPYMARLPPPPGIPPPPSGLSLPVGGVVPTLPSVSLPPGLSAAPPVSLDAAVPAPIYYPSMDPSQFGSRPAEGQPAKKKVKTGPDTSVPVNPPADSRS